MTYEKLADGVIVDDSGAAVDTSPYICVQRDMAGYFACLMHFNTKDVEPGHGPGFWEPWDTGYGRYPDKEAAEVEAHEWAKDEGVKFRRS